MLNRLCALFLLTAAFLAAEDLAYPSVTIENTVARAVVSSYRGGLDRLEIKGVKPLALPKHLQREGDGADADVAVLGAFWQPPTKATVAAGTNLHNWLMNDAATPTYGLSKQDFAPWTVVPGSQTADAVSFTYRSPKGLVYTMAYRMDAKRPTVHSRLTIRNESAAPLTFTPYLLPINGIHQDYGPNEVGYANYVWHTAGAAHGKTFPSDGTPVQIGEGLAKDYVGVKSRFFAAWFTPGRLSVDGDEAAVPVAPTPAGPAATGPGATVPMVAAPTSAWRADVAGFFSKPHADHQAYLTVTYAPLQVPVGRTLTQEWSLTGTSLTHQALLLVDEPERRLAVTDWMHSLFLVLTSGMTWVLDLLVKVVVNYGVAVVLLTLLIKAVLFKLTWKQHSSMLKMQKLAPELKYLQEQYKNDKQQLALKQMELWKKNGVNPLGGCLPMLIQIPIFIALYNTFNYSADMRGHSFLWIPDLTLPDQVWGVAVPFLNNWVLSFNPLPILYIIATAVMSFTQPIPPSTDEQQEQMAKMMRWMPIVFGFIFYNMPSGLVLYFTANAVLSTIEVKFIRRKLGVN